MEFAIWLTRVKLHKCQTSNQEKQTVYKSVVEGILMNWSFLLTWRSLPSLRVSWCLTMHQQVAAGLHPFTSTLQIVSTMHMCSNYLHRINLISFTLSVASSFLSLSCTVCFLININVHVGLVTVVLKMRRATQSCNNLFIKNQHSVSRIWQTLHLSGNRKKNWGGGSNISRC